MRICMMSYDYLPNPGGVASHVHFLTKALLAAGHEVSLLACHLPGLPEPSSLPPIDGLRAWDNAALSAAKLRRLSDAARRARCLREWHRIQPFDIVHYHSLRHDTIAVQLAFRRSGPPRVFTNHTSGFLSAARCWHRRPCLRWELLRATHIIAPSEELRDVTISLRVPATRVSYIPNGVDTAVFQPSACPPSDAVVLATRRLVHKNGIDLLITAWPHVLTAVPEARLVLAGDGPERRSLELAATELGIASSVQFLGSVDRELLPRLYRAATLAVLPSRMEAVSISALEAMSSGLPVVATRVGGLPHVVRPRETGLLADAESPTSIAKGITAVLAMPDRGRSLGLRGRQLVDREYSWQRIAHDTAAVYEQCVARPRSQPVS